MELDTKLEPVLAKIDFVNRYRNLSDSFQSSPPYFSNYENSKVVELLKKTGYDAKYMKGESFFKILQKESGFQFQFNISIKNGIVELIWDVLENGERLQLGGPWGLIARLLLQTEERIKLPTFRNYEDLEKIFKEAFSIYEDFKSELTKQESKS